MSNGRKHPATSDLTNPTLIENSNYKQRAEKLKREHDKWESKQKFQVIRPDHKTVIYRRIVEEKAKIKSEIHKGRI